MCKIQFGKPEEKTGFGIGFLVSEFEGKKRIGHGGAVYGFATEFGALPDDKLGVIVWPPRTWPTPSPRAPATMPCAACWRSKQGKPLPSGRANDQAPSSGVAQPWPAAIGPRRQGTRVDRARRPPVPARRSRAASRTEVRQLGQRPHGRRRDRLWARRSRRDGDTLTIGKETFERVERSRSPSRCPAKWHGLIGEYGWDHNTLYILEKDGKLHALIEWFFLYPLEEVTPDVYKFPELRPVHRREDRLHPRRKTAGRREADAASVPFARRTLDGENGTFKIKPVRPVAELRRWA